MEKRTQRIHTLCLTVAVASCSTAPSGSSNIPLAAPAPSVASTHMCAPAPSPAPDQCVALRDTSANTCVLKKIQGRDRTVCQVLVGATTGGLFVYPYTLSVPHDAPDVHVVWNVLDRSLSFDTNDDGPCFTNPSSNGRFKEGQPTDDPDGGNGNGNSAKRFRVKYDASGGIASHDYVIQAKFKTGTGEIKAFTCDPLINNSGN